MTNPAIRVEGLGKRYRLGELEPYRALREVVNDALGTPARWLRRGTRPSEKRSQEFVWALRDVSFDIAPGEIVGFIGRNGAGKTTMLKLLARITQPTEGKADVYGDVGALLEVGTGFHPELTGRENVFLNGAILGMPHTQIQRKFDDIVDFAGIDRFIDTPIKRYSSGMQVRLAFAVAAHFEPDILLVDEVLAVGDIEFQKRCMGRMEEVGASGRTVLFISHSMSAILRLCPRVILFDHGRVVADGSAHDVVRTYLDSGSGTTAAREWDRPRAPGDDAVRLKSVRVRSDGKVADEVDIRRPVDVEVEYWHESTDPSLRPDVLIGLANSDGVLLFISSNASDHAWRERPRKPGLVRSTCRIPGNFLAEGQTFVHVGIRSQRQQTRHVREGEVVAFQVVDHSTGDAARADFVDDWHGVIRPLLEWSTDLESTNGPHGPPRSS